MLVTTMGKPGVHQSKNEPFLPRIVMIGGCEDYGKVSYHNESKFGGCLVTSLFSKIERRRLNKKGLGHLSFGVAIEVILRMPVGE